MLRRVIVSAAAVCGLVFCPSGAAQTFSDFGGTVLGVDLNARSASLADIDNDGDLDLFFQGALGAQKLYRNGLIGGAGLGFTDASSLLPTGLGSSWSSAWADVNGDGLVDVFVGQSNLGAATGDYLLNAGASGFGNASVATGLNDAGFHQNVAWADIDNDLDLDLVLGMEGPQKHEIYLQGPGSNFTPVGSAVGFQEDLGYKGYGMAIGDTDGDGDLDVYISTCRGDNNVRNNFYENQLAQTGSLSFIDIADTNGTQNYRNSYGAEFMDFDDDGDLDLFVVGADKQPTKIYRNDGGNQFTDVDTLTGQPLLSDVGGDLGGGRAVDYDNDGDLDLFIHDHLPADGNQARKLYRNDGNWQFTDVTNAEGLAAGNEGSYDSPWADIDRDGDMDLIATTGNGYDERVFLSNATENGNHWLQVELNGPSYNTTGLGSSLYVTMDTGGPEQRTLRREANTNAGTFNQSDLPVHFGLGDVEVVDELKIVWSDGAVQYLLNVPVDQYFAVTYDPTLAGDFNDDGTVNLADYVVWRNLLGSSVSMPNETTTPGVVDVEDYAVWKANFGGTSTSTAATQRTNVPEPAAATILSMAVLGFYWFRRPTVG